MKSFVIGDSISQGFISGRASRGELAYPKLIHDAMGWGGYSHVRYPHDGPGLFVDLEWILRDLEGRYGANIRGLEWALALNRIRALFDEAEDLYERDALHEEQPHDPPASGFGNVACYGFTVADAWNVTPNVCRQRIAASQRGDGLFHLPSAPFYRNALRVLRPDPQDTRDFSQLDWLKHTAETEGVENVILWLGGNNALATVLRLKVFQKDPGPGGATITHTPSMDDVVPGSSEISYNLWHPSVFEADYRELMRRVSDCMANNVAADWRVFIGTVPEVTIAPLAKGVGPTSLIAFPEDEDGHQVPDGYYFKYYTYFPFEVEYAHKGGPRLSLHDALHIDRCIHAYNATIRDEVRRANELLINRGDKTRYHVVDIASSLRALAWKRNGGHPTYTMPKAIQFMYPQVNTKFYHADRDGQLRQGGLFSLDGVHPTAIGQGLLAYEFLKVMRDAGVPGADPDALDWRSIVASDTLYNDPLRLMGEAYENPDFAGWIVQAVHQQLG